VWLKDAYHKHYQVLQYLPAKLAQWTGENMQEELRLQDRKDQQKRSVSELKTILFRHVVSDRNGCALHTLSCLKWESELYKGVMRARGYPFNMPGGQIHNIKVRVYWARVIPYLSCTIPA
jgi:hypothetical protein